MATTHGGASASAASTDEGSAMASRLPRRKLPWRGLLFGVIAVALVAALRWRLDSVLEEGLPYTLFLAAVAIATHHGGLVGGVSTMTLSGLVGTYLFTSPRFVFAPSQGHTISLLVFIAASAMLMWMIERETALRRRLEERDILLRAGYEDRTRLQSDLEEARRLESLGRLAGGVAHDFNNLLGVILGYGDLLRRDLPDNKMLESIMLAATRGSEITKQLLGLGRRQMMVLRNLTVDDVVREAMQLYESLLPENVDVQVELEPEPWQFEGDVTMMQQVLLNLLVNARDALTTGGTIFIASENAVLDDAFALQHPDVTPGDYVRLSVVDAGIGMSSATLERVFEPFFSSKESGTGMGLAVVYGIVKQLRGHIFVASELGQGTRFDIYFPRVGASQNPASERDERVPHVTGRLNVMLVEDHPLVRAVLERMLESLGHTTSVSEDGMNALALARCPDTPLDVLVTDVVMPRIDGYALAERLRKERPGVGVVLISGYSESAALHGLASRSRFVFLRKPFTAVQLNEALCEARALQWDGAGIAALSLVH
jgi:signal transduction histidine kinase/ActR/RegA family two-component response regulator